MYIHLECTVRILEMKMNMKRIHKPHGSQYIEKIPSIYYKKESSHVALPLEETVENKGKSIKIQMNNKVDSYRKRIPKHAYDKCEIIHQTENKFIRILLYLEIKV